MHLLLLNIIIIVLIPGCFNDSNITESSIRTCGKCSPCWNVFGENYGPCSNMNYNINPFVGVQPVCIDTLILLIILFVSIITFLPSCIWLLYLWIKGRKDDDTRYIIDASMII